MTRSNVTHTTAAALLLLASLIACSSAPGPDDGGTQGPTGGSDGGTADGGVPWNHFPPSTGAAAIRDFLALDPHRDGGWVVETIEPRPPGAASPHGHVRVYFNPTLQASIKAGNGAWDGGMRVGGPHDPGSMVVKEMHEVMAPDGGEPMIARAAILKTDAGDSDVVWTYFCIGPSDGCAGQVGTEAKPIYGNGATLFLCHSCHAGNIFTPLP